MVYTSLSFDMLRGLRHGSAGRRGFMRRLQGERSSFTVPLIGQRHPPVLSLPPEVGMGPVMVGNEQVTEVGFQNEGGPGRFKLVADKDWPHNVEGAPADVMVAGAFK